jgi:precorrin-4/cobalt-precorrin-4 C11-methyltransferase
MAATPRRCWHTLATFAASGTTLAIHLSIHAIDKIVAELLPFDGADCPAAFVYRAGSGRAISARARFTMPIIAGGSEPDRAY